MSQRLTVFKDTNYELFIGALSLLAITNLALYYFIEQVVVSGVILIINWLLSLIFLGDFLYRLATAPSKLQYLVRSGWADLISCIPLPWTKALRMVRVVYTSKALGRRRSRRIIREFLSDRADSALLVLFFVIVLILEFGGMGMVAVESRSPEANIRTPSDALWYTFVTITTVGYGDRYPVTGAGKMIGVIIMFAGVGLFGTLTGYLANAFLSPRKPKSWMQDADMPWSRLSELQQMLEAQKQIQADLETKIRELEQWLSQRMGGDDITGSEQHNRRNQ